MVATVNWWEWVGASFGDRRSGCHSGISVTQVPTLIFCPSMRTGPGSRRDQINDLGGRALEFPTSEGAPAAHQVAAAERFLAARISVRRSSVESRSSSIVSVFTTTP